MSLLKRTVLGVLGSRLMPRAKIDDVEVLSNRFRLISLTCEDFKHAAMQPTAKIRVNAGDWEMRAYTPLWIEGVTGRVQILAYLHGEGPGSRWARSAAPGDVTHILGPQPSLALAGLSQSTVFFGDETSLAAARTLQSHASPDQARVFVFEVSSPAEARGVADRLGLRNVTCFERQPGEMHIPLVIEAIQRAMGDVATSHLVLTGNSRSIQSIRANLRAVGSSAIDYHVRAYWTPGKVGLE